MHVGEHLVLDKQMTNISTYAFKPKDRRIKLKPEEELCKLNIHMWVGGRLGGWLAASSEAKAILDLN